MLTIMITSVICCCCCFKDLNDLPEELLVFNKQKENV